MGRYHGGVDLGNTLQVTEQQNSASRQLDELPTSEILKLMNEEDRGVPEAISKVLPEISAAVEVLVESWNGEGRWIYVGAGTSGRVAALDAAECPPTFGVSPDRVRALLAGGDKAVTQAIEGAEDDRNAAVRDLDALDLGPNDAVVGLAASGRTPYVVAAVEHASGVGCATVGISNNPGSELGETALISIEVVAGPEVLTGSTRLKAGTSQKLVLNMLSTAAFTRLGKVYENFMVDVQATNEKLKGRARRIVCDIAEVPVDEADRLLQASNGSVKLAVVMAKAQVSAGKAQELLGDSRGNVRQALKLAGIDGR